MYNPGITTTVGSYAEAANSTIQLIFVDTDVDTGQKFCSMDVTLPWGTLDYGFGGSVGDIITRSGTDRFYAMKILDINITNQSATLQVLSYARGLPANVGITKHNLPSISNPGSTINYDFELTNSSAINANIRWLFASKVTIQTDTTYPTANSSEALPPTIYKKLGCWYDDWALGGACATGQTVIANGGTSHITGNFTLTSDTGKYENIALRIFVYVSNYWATGKHEYVEVGGNALLHQLLADYSHLECVSGTCTQVTGIGTNTCTTIGSTTECATIDYTHILEIRIHPWGWYTPDGAVEELLTKLNDINGWCLNLISGLTDWEYIRTDILTEGSDVVIQSKFKNLSITTKSMYITPLAASFFANVVVAIEYLIVIAFFVGILYSVKFFGIFEPSDSPDSEEKAPTYVPPPEKQLPGVKDAVDNSGNNCLTGLPSNPTCTDLNNYAICLDSVHIGVYGTLKSVYPNFEEFQTTYNEYLNKYVGLVSSCNPDIPGSTPSDIQQKINETQQDYIKELEDDFKKLQDLYESSLCCIKLPYIGCIISKELCDTAKTAAYVIVGGVVIYLGYNIYTSMQPSKKQ